MAIVVLLQKDLRLIDNPALYYAAKKDLPIIPVYICEADKGSASKWWRLKSLRSLAAGLNNYGLPLLYFEGNLTSLIREIENYTEVNEVYWNYCGEDWLSEIPDGKEFSPNLLFPQKTSQRPYKVFSAYWRYCQQLPVQEPLPKPEFKEIHKPKIYPLRLAQIPEYSPHWANGIEEYWNVGEDAAQQRWCEFQDNALMHYTKGRDIPSKRFTSELSPHLHFGEISVRQIWHTLHRQPFSQASEKYLSEIGWREFNYHVLYHSPSMVNQPLNKRFETFAWQTDEALLEKWKKGQTGYPIIDAGMRQLWQIGWMHNRVRMLVASFLTKNLLIPWQIGAEWFNDTLVDSDTANNSFGWQWVAGSGYDSAPYFRIFNPVLQGKRFDSDGSYVRKWVLELKDLDEKYIHTPWLAPQFDSLNYPKPIVDLQATRVRALAAVKALPKQ